MFELYLAIQQTITKYSKKLGRQQKENLGNGHGVHAKEKQTNKRSMQPVAP
jgi:hypothetical protein